MPQASRSFREEILGKVRGDQVPRIPFATYNLHPFGSHGDDPSYAPLLALVERQAGMLVKADLRRVGGSDGEREWRVENLPGETRTTTVWHTPKGDLRSVTATPHGQPSYVVEPFIKSDADIARVLSVPYTPPQFDSSGVRALLDQIGTRGVLYLSYPDPMYAAASLFDYEEFVVRCVTEPERLQELIDAFAERAAGEVERLAAASAGLPVLFYTAGPELATPPMLPPSVFARFVTPHQKRIIGILHRHGHLACIHCHGRVRLVLDEILETGADALEPIEPPPQGDISLAELLERVAGRLCLMGYVQDQEFYRSRPGEIRRHVAEVAALLNASSRYVMLPTCTPFQHPASPAYVAAYTEWIEAAAELLPGG